MRLIRMSTPVGWFVAGCGLVASGGVLVLLVSVEVGMAFTLIGTGALGFAVGLMRSEAADRELIAQIERHVADQRAEDRRQIEKRWRMEGASPTEQSYRSLRQFHTDETDGALADLDVRLGRLIQTRCDRIWEGIRDRRYVQEKDGRIAGVDGKAIFSELRDVVKEVARLYKKDADKAELEARIGDIALAARSAIGELLQAARHVPGIDVTRWTVAEIMTALEAAQKARHLYERITPYQPYIRGAWLVGSLALGASPVTQAARVLLQEATMRVGKHVLQTYAGVWLKELLEGSVALVYLQVARTYEPQSVYRSAEWLALVEALRVHGHVAGIDRNRKLLLGHILRARIPDEFAKMALLRALAEDGKPDTPQDDVVPPGPALRREIAERLGAILRQMRGLNEPEASQAIEETEKRLSIGLEVDLIDAGSREEVRIEEGFIQLATVACDWCRLDIAEAQQVIEGSAFAMAARKHIGDVDVNRVLREKAMPIVFDGGVFDGDRVAESPLHLIEPPRDLVGDSLAEPLLSSVVDLLATKAAADWPVEHDQMVLFNASVLLTERQQVTALWSRYLKAVESRLLDRLKHRTLSTVPPRSAPGILRQIGDQELRVPEGIVIPRIRPRPVAVFEASAGDARARWVLLFADRVVVGEVPKEELSLDDGEPRTYPKDDVRFGRLSRPLADALAIHCGGDQCLIVDGPVKGTFTGYFGPVLESLDLDAAALKVVENA